MQTHSHDHTKREIQRCDKLGPIADSGLGKFGMVGGYEGA